MGKESESASQILNANSAQQVGRGVALDGIIARNNYERIFAAKPTGRTARRTAQSAQRVHHSLKKSVTLMRQTMPKPKELPRIKTDIKRSSQKSQVRTVEKIKLAKVSPARMARAKQVVRDAKVNRFGSSMAPLPKHIARPLKPAVGRLSAKVATVARPISPSFQVSNSSTVAIPRPMPVLAPRRTVNNDRLEEMLDKALQQADAHREILKAHRHRSLLSRIGRRWMLLSLISAILVLAAGGALAYYKIPGVAVKLAALRTGVNAASPSYIPPGFSLSQTQFKNGGITFKYSAPAGSLMITEQKSGLTSQSLRDSVVASQNQVYQTTQFNGVTIYTYHPLQGAVSQSSAAAVNDGTQTTVTNQANLSSDQIVKTLQSIYSH